MLEVQPYAHPDTERGRDDAYYLNSLAMTHEVLGFVGASLGLFAHPGSNAGGPIVMIGGSILLLVSGVCMHLRCLRHFSIILAGILLVPLGIFIPIYTLRLLTRNGVVVLYGAGAARV